MTSAAEQLKVVLQELPYGDRAELAHFLLDSLDADVPPPGPASDESLDETLNRRLKEILDGTEVGEPAFEAVARIRRKYQ